MAADSDVGRMLAEVQGMGETVPRQRAPRANPDGEVARTLTEVELAGGDVSAMVNNLSPDQLNEFAAVQGYYRDVIDLVPLNRADYDANRGALNPSVTDPIFLHAPDGERPRVFVNVEDAGSIKAGDLGRAFLKSESLPDRQVTAMINSVDTLYTPEQIAARERAIAKAEIDAKYAKQGVKGGATDAEIDLRLAMLRSKSQTEFGDANIWSRQAIAAEDLSNGIVDWNRMRRGLPKGNNPITHLENVLGAQARGLIISGVRIDPETGRPLDTPESIKRTNPAAADDPAVAQGLKNYTEGYNKMRRDPANETPTTEPVSPERAAAIELSMTDAPLRARQIMDLAGGPDGPDLAPTDPNFGWRREGNKRVLAGMRLPDRIRLANHWRNELPKIDEIQRYMDSGEYVVMRWDTLGDSADVTKREGPQAITREGRILRWNATTGRKREKYKGGGNLNVQIADYTTLRNNVLTVIENRHPALDPQRGGPGYTIEGIMADVDIYLANRRSGAEPGNGLTPERLRVTQGLVEGRRGNIFEGVLKTDGIVREARIELVETIQPTGRRGHNMVSNTESGAFVQPQPKPMPDMGSDVVPPSTRFRPNMGSQSGAIDLSIITDLFGEGPKGRAQGMPDAPASGRGQAMPDITITPEEARRQGLVGPVYHGSPDFKGRKFDPKYRARSSGLSRGGFSFTEDVAAADSYAMAGVDPAQAAVDAANDVMRELAERMESGLKLRTGEGPLGPNYGIEGPFVDPSELPEFNVRYVDDMDELAAYFNDLAKSIPKDLGDRLRDAAKAINEPANPVVVEAYLRNPKEMMIGDKRLLVAENPDDIFVSAARPPQATPSAAPRGQAMPDAKQ
jgi:hypothetical protein